VPHTQANSVDLNAVLARLGRPIRVLIAEDNPTNQFVVKKMLSEFKLSLHMAANGQEAIDSAMTFSPDVIFMDMRMPEVDGLTATRQIRAMGGTFATLPICAVTANAFADDIKACRDSGMNDFIAKPIRKALLIDKLAQIAEASKEAVDLAPSIVPDAVPSAGPAAAPGGARAVLQAAASDTPLIDRAVVAVLFEEIGEDGADAVLQVFLAETQARLALMRTLDCERERDRVNTEAHTLKGSSSTFGFKQLSKAAAELEHKAGIVTAVDYPGHVSRLEDIFKALRKELDAAPLVAA
jgi:CheY-like chemotaxis protein/HPt (histidine-containing phosphotransfer) domain-containing protein